VQSLRVVDILESSARRTGMNLTFEVRDGILNHNGDTTPRTLEGCIVKTADRIAYINHDIDDALRSGIIVPGDLPADAIGLLGAATNKRIDSLIRDMVEQSDNCGEIRQSPAHKAAMDKLRKFLFENVYFSPRVKADGDQEEINALIFGLYDYFLARPDKIPEEYAKLIPEFGLVETVKDHVASMTDRFAREMGLELKQQELPLPT
jgi:dGTPase